MCNELFFHSSNKTILEKELSERERQTLEKRGEHERVMKERANMESRQKIAAAEKRYLITIQYL